ncbi:MAG: DUF4157 domain-containing protein [Daejeonella sp.]|uniref:eCIS core domain-containing protein n=1 Tax=Daejeonella sp. TaxID=2805397 RepID=UPI002737233A|nr:DUF4157 domain-containing protein [Daejeonella sp.]MDP3468743.1 DUF4157 domain-containing protein [Daejeonella sp.]
MNVHAPQTSENNSRAAAAISVKQQSSGEELAEVSQDKLLGTAPLVQRLRTYQDMANNSQQVKQLRSYQQMADQNKSGVAQRTENPAPQQSSLNQQNNNTGLPDQLKSGIENLSGYSLDDVKVHYNSDKPATLQAHAYAQGTDIHVASGQDRHLPHEAWHVVQQKQGRVKPTLQLKGKEDETEEFFDLAETGEEEGIKAEKKVEPKSAAHRKKLDELKKSGAHMGEESQIKFQGELTVAARLNRFFGNESSYSQILRLSDEFNKSQDVAEKQALLKELKPLARTWLERHAQAQASGEKEDENEKAKRVSIYRFLNQTTSNYPEIINKYRGLQTSLENFVSNPVTNRKIFHKSVGDYRTLLELVKTYKSTYPPSVNLLYTSELDDINAAEHGLIKSGSKEGSDFDTNLGFSVLKPAANFNLISGKYWFSGELKISLAGIISTNGTVKIEFNSDDTFNNITVDGKSAKFEMDGVIFEMSKFSYTYKENTFNAAEATGSVEVLGRKISLKAFDTSIKQGQADFNRLEGKINGIIDTQMGIQVIDPTIKYFKGQAIEVKGELDLTIGNLANAKGRVTVRVDTKNTIENIKIKNGRSEANIGGLNLKLNGIAYNYSAKKFSVQEARGGINIFDNPVALTVSGISITESGFDYDKIEGELPDVDYSFFSLKKTSIAYSKKLSAFEGETTYQFNTKESPVGFENFQTGGDVKIHWNPEGEKYYSIDQGNLKFELLGQKVEAKKFNFSSKEQKINAEELSLSVGIKDLNKTFTGKNIAISKSGIAFEELKTDASGNEFNVKVFTLKPKEYKIAKGKDGSLKVMVHGSMNLNLPEYLGIKSTGEIEGDVGLSFNESVSPDYQITSGKAEIKMPNPLNKISEILGDNWSSSRYELSATIPVFPAVSAIFGIYIEYGGKFAKELAAIIELDNEKKSIMLNAKTNFTANVEGGVFGGIQGGSQLLIALALLLRAAGKFDMNTEIGYQKGFPLEEEPASKNLKDDDSGFTYDIQGEAKVGAYLDIVATALYFFRKQFSLTLGEKSLGKFEFSNKKRTDPDMGKNALADKEMLDKHVDPSVKEEAKGLTIEQLLDLDYNHRFAEKEKQEAIDVIKTAETGRTAAYQKDNQLPGESKKFNNVALANLQFYNQFIDNRCNWDEIYKVLDSLGDSLKPESELMSQVDKGEKYLKEQILSNVKILGSSSNIAQAFVTHYNEKVKAFAEAYPKDIISSYHALLLEKSKVLEAVEKIKKEHLHSKFWGDDSLQSKTIKTGAWFGASDYEKFATAYLEFRKVMLTNKTVFESVSETGKQTAFKLVQDHQRQIEKGSK